MTPTDVAGWVQLAPILCLAFLALLGLAGIIEGTDRGRRLADRLVRWVVR